MFTITLLLCAVGCATKYPNWQYVRIESSVPNKECKYKIQEACSKTGADCYDWYKQRATTFDANTVVITSQTNAQSSVSTVVATGGTVGGGSSSKLGMIALADYYSCPVSEK